MNSNVMMQKLVLIAPLVARVVLYVLIGLSVLSIGVILERWWFFRRRRDNIGALSDAVRKGLARGDVAAVTMSDVLAVLRDNVERTRALLHEVIPTLPAADASCSCQSALDQGPLRS